MNHLSPIISFKNFSFRYKSQQEPSLININLNIYPGEKVLILGPSGSGKSTLGKCINGLIPNRNKGKLSGQVIINGKSITTTSIFERSKDVGTVLQDSDAQFVGLSVEEDIAFYLENLNTPLEQMQTATINAAKTVEVDSLLKQLPFDLSGGQKQRAEIAGILHGNTPILLFDEPLAALNPDMSHSMIELIDRLNQEQNKTVIIIEHRLEEVLHRHIDRIILLNNGEIVKEGTPDDFLKSSILNKYGIRVPLYLSCIKKINGKIEQDHHLWDPDTINIEPYQKSFVQFLRNNRSSNQVPINNSSTAIEIKNLLFGYDHQYEASHIPYLKINKGERVSIVGKNGSGKSTLAKLLTGVLRPNSGEIIENNQKISHLTIQEIGQNVGYIMQNPNKMIVKDTVEEEVGLALELKGFEPSIIKERVKEALQITDLYSMRHWPINALSFGQKRRLNIASVLVLRPSCLILDEPTAGQDYLHYRKIMDFIADIAAKQQITLLIITHDMQLTLEYTNRALVIDNGHIIADEQPATVLNDSELVKRAGLVQTSIIKLANRLGINGKQLTEATIRH